VEITQSHTTTIETPLPGIAVIQKSTNGYGSLYLEDKSSLVWLYNLRDNQQQQETLYLQREPTGWFSAQNIPTNPPIRLKKLLKLNPARQ